jgi:clan AA aspartic protease (TIGR02281 family)
VQRAGTALLVSARVNETLNVPFLVDTGASDVSVPRWAAERLGIEGSGRTREYMTANGVVVEPVVTLRSVDVGGARVEDLSASISGSMEIGLLGLGFFNHFTTHVDTARGLLTLIPNDLVESGGIRGGRSEEQWRTEFAGLRDRLARVDAEESRTNPNQSTKLRDLEARRDDLLRQLEILEAEADHARVPLVWRE